MLSSEVGISNEQSKELQDESKTTVEKGVDHNVARIREIENNFRRACNYMENNDFDKASRIFRSVIMFDHTNYKALTGLGKCLAEM